MERKKKVAAMAAVIAHIKTGEEIQTRQKKGRMEVSSPETLAFESFVCRPPNIWGLTGRQIMMQANTMMQQRMFK